MDVLDPLRPGSWMMQQRSRPCAFSLGFLQALLQNRSTGAPVIIRTHHAMSCDKLAGLRTLRHAHVQSSVQYGVTAAGHGSSIEPQKDLRFRDEAMFWSDS
jgi:hypothetical protein